MNVPRNINTFEINKGAGTVFAISSSNVSVIDTSDHQRFEGNSILRFLGYPTLFRERVITSSAEQWITADAVVCAFNCN